MNSKVIHLYDYTSAPIPEDLRRWRVTEAEIDQAMEQLSAAHAREKEVGSARTGDCVVCCGESGSPIWNRPVLLFYPGFGLCDRELEDALVGRKAGEKVKVSAHFGEVTLTVLRVLRGREPYPICDNLVKLQKIDGVETVAEYRRWFRQTTETQRRGERGIPIAVFLLQQILKESQVFIDESEETSWTQEWVEFQMDRYAERGLDWKTFEGITPSMSEEEAARHMFENYRGGFRDCIVFRALLEQSGEDTDAVCKKGLEQFAQDQNQTPEEYLKGISRSALEFSILMKEAKQIVFDYAQQHLDELLEE